MYSQFKYYASWDLYAPQLTGQSGSLIDVLDGVLINGYGTKSPAKWLKPIPNDPNYALACYQIPSGSKMIMHVNDAAPHSASANARTREAWVTGYEGIVGLTHSLNYTHGTGYGQFPYTNHTSLGASLTSGSLVWKKSNTLDDFQRPWIVFVDDQTMYMFVQTGISANTWELYMFGDIFSYKQTRDEYKCMMIGRLNANVSVEGLSTNPCDYIFQVDNTSYPHFMARTWGGGGRAIRAQKMGDAGKCNLGATGYATMAGVLQVPNAVDGAMYMSPLWVTESDYGVIRGRMRGLWFPCHPVASFGDGQVINGTGELSGKTFRIVKPGPGGGMWAVEISNTVDTNEE